MYVPAAGAVVSETVPLVVPFKIIEPVEVPVVPTVISEANVGEVPKTARPDPVSFVRADDKFAEENEPSELAFPTEVIAPVRFAFVVTVAALPVMLPEIGFVTVKFVSVPTDVRDELKIFDASVAPVNVPASAAIVMFEDPSKLTPLMVRAF